MVEGFWDHGCRVLNSINESYSFHQLLARARPAADGDSTQQETLAGRGIKMHDWDQFDQDFNCKPSPLIHS